jgi:hypothetical protein
METSEDIAGQMKEFLDVKHLGYQTEHGVISAAVNEMVVRLRDNTNRTVWRVISFDNNMKTVSVSGFILKCPRIDIKAQF